MKFTQTAILIRRKIILQKTFLLSWKQALRLPTVIFLDDVTDSARYTLKDCGLKSSTVTVNTSELDHKGRIGIQKARELALAHAGLKDAVFSEGEYDLDDGIMSWNSLPAGMRIRIRSQCFHRKNHSS